jgi:prephenate dehydrogenase
MKQPLRDCRIGIIGLGLMGGSLALALQGKVKHLTGIDKDPATIATAISRKIIDQGQTRLTTALKPIDLIILAMPVMSIIETIPKLPSIVTEKTLVMDLGSTKRAVMDAFRALSQPMNTIGGHPMCGKASGGLINADANLYQSAAFALIKSDCAPPSSQRLAEALVTAVGARPLWMDADVHDRIAANVSHLPYLVSCALIESAEPAVADLIGPGYRSASRLAATPGAMMNHILETNQDQILIQLDVFIEKMDKIRSLVAAKDFDNLFTNLAKIRAKLADMLAVNERDW